MKQHLLLSLFLVICLFGCADDERPSYSYLALGDSYTIGQGLEDEADRWPVQLAAKLNEQGTAVRAPKIIAQTGWQTSALKNALDTRGDIAPGYDLVSLLIGVNNQFSGRSPESFEPEFEELLDRSVALGKNRKDRVFVLSIPDYGVTGFGMSWSSSASEGIDQYNAICERVCAEKGIQFFNITELSRLAPDDDTLFAPDRLHYSGLMHAMWVDLIFEDVQALLAD